MLVSEVMTSDVKTVGPTDTVLDAVSEMVEFNVGCVVVVKGTRLEGIVTDSDVLAKVVSEDKKASAVKVSDMMSSDVVMIEHNKDIDEAVELMREHNVKKLPVTKGSSLVGILTSADLAQAQPKLLEKISSLMVFPKQRKNVAG